MSQNEKKKREKRANTYKLKMKFNGIKAKKPKLKPLKRIKFSRKNRTKKHFFFVETRLQFDQIKGKIVVKFNKPLYLKSKHF